MLDLLLITDHSYLQCFKFHAIKNSLTDMFSQVKWQFRKVTKIYPLYLQNLHPSSQKYPTLSKQSTTTVHLRDENESVQIPSVWLVILAVEEGYVYG
jgi:hypothetical protein